MITTTAPTPAAEHPASSQLASRVWSGGLVAFIAAVAVAVAGLIVLTAWLLAAPATVEGAAVPAERLTAQQATDRTCGTLRAAFEQAAPASTLLPDGGDLRAPGMDVLIRTYTQIMTRAAGTVHVDAGTDPVVAAAAQDWVDSTLITQQLLARRDALAVNAVGSPRIAAAEWAARNACRL